LGTQADNNKDKARDGTHRNMATITEAVARAIKASKGHGTIKSRASRFGVTYGIVSAIDNGYAWNDIE
jgi:hypothetical protein